MQVFLHVLRGWDKKLRVDRVRGFIQWVQTEYEARKCIGFEQAFKKVRARGDWLKPKNAAASWKSAVDWLAADRVDPQTKEETVSFNHEGLNQEVRQNAEKEALVLNARKRLDELGEAPPDRINLH